MADLIKETLAFKELSPEEKEKRGILGRLYGPIADVVNPTRNGRAYTDELWEKVFNDNAIVKELLSKGGIPGELDHPAERDDIDSSKIAIMMPEAPKKDKDGHLIAYFDILDTPNGRIAYELAKYGFQLGISSRGNGDVMDNDEVDPNTYDFKCFDLVLIPSVKDARLKMSEGLASQKTLSQALCESLQKAKPEEQKIMNETLKDLNISLTEDIKPIKKDNDKVDDVIVERAKNESKTEAVNNGSTQLIEALQNALKQKSELQSAVQKLQEQLAVSNTMAGKLDETKAKAKENLDKILAENKDLKLKVSTLTETLTTKGGIIASQNNQIKRLIEEKAKSKKILQESLTTSSNRDASIVKLNTSLKQLNEQFNQQKVTYEKQLADMSENLKKQTSSSIEQINDWKSKAAKSIKLKEDYKTLANSIMNNYIDSKATMLDISAQEIKNKLPQSYTIQDVDDLCESLQTYALNINNLPFSVNRKVNKVQVTQSQNEALHLQDNTCDDDVDDFLLRTAHLKN